VKKPAKKPTAAQVKSFWDVAKDPSTRTVAKAMMAQGFSINYRTVARYKDADWEELAPPGRLNKHGKSVKANKKIEKIAKALSPQVAAEILAAAVSPEYAQVRVARMIDLYTRSLSENTATLQNTGVIAAILVAEDVVASLGHLMITEPGDVARLLSAITEATQVKHVGGPGQVPEAGDARVIEAVANKSTDARDAVARFRATAGL